MAARKPAPKDVDAWLRSETPHHLGLLSRLRETLESTLEKRIDENGDLLPADVNEAGTPTRDWFRGMQRYQTSYIALMVEQRERYKLRLLAEKAGANTLSDEEYDNEMRELAREAIRELPTADLASEFLRRGMPIPVDDVDSDDPDQ